jgi:predicted nucleic acid-binding protein
MRTIVVDSAPLILMSKLSLLDIFCGNFHALVPPEVVTETTRRHELMDAKEIARFLKEGRLEVKSAAPQKLKALALDLGLEGGEAAALALAMEEGAVMMSDDYMAMRAAKFLRVKFVTTPDVIIEFHRGEFLKFDSARAKLSELKKHAWISPAVLRKAFEVLEGGQ